MEGQAVGIDVLDDTLAGAVIRGQAALAELRHADQLIQAAHALVEATGETGWPLLVPSTTESAALVGAAVAISGGAVASLSVGDEIPGGAKVLAVASVAVSGLAVRQTVKDLRAGGADWVGAFVWRLESADPGHEPDMGDLDCLVVGSR